MSLIDFILGWFKRRKPKPPDVTPPPPASRTLLEAVNAYRARQGRPPFVGDSCLDQQASDHAADVWNGIARVHDGFANRLQACGKWPGAENWAQARTPDDAVAMWSTSPGHRANMLSSFIYCGTAIAEESAVMICGNTATRSIGIGKPIVDRSNERMSFAVIVPGENQERG